MNVVDVSQNDFFAVLSGTEAGGCPTEDGTAILEAGRSMPRRQWERLAAYAQGMGKASGLGD